MLSALLVRRAEAEDARRKTRRKFKAADLCRRGTRVALEQLAFINEPSRWKVACCSRRAGKTHACAILLLDYALSQENALCLYVTLTRLSAKRIVWKRLLKLNREYGLGGTIDRSELTISFPNGSEVRIMGCKDESEADKIRGIDPAPRLVVIDEAQAFRPYIQELVEDALEPMLIETKGTMVLIGTPGPVRAGYFYEACRSASPERLEAMNVAANDNAAGVQWSVHHWTIEQNPFIDDVVDELAALRKRKKWTADHPTYQREYRGRWVTEHDALVYKFDHGRNTYERFDGLISIEPSSWRCIVGVDQGYHDADSVTVSWFRPGHPGIWVEEASHARKQSSGDLVAAVDRIWQAVKGRCMAIVWDEGGGGVKTAEDARRLGLPVEAAEKGPGSVVASIEITNTALLNGCLKVPLDGQAAADAPRVTWDPKAPGVKLSERYHTDIWDAIRYTVRKLVGIVPLDRGAIVPIAALDEEKAARDRSARIAGRMKANSGNWVKRALG